MFRFGKVSVLTGLMVLHVALARPEGRSAGELESRDEDQQISRKEADSVDALLTRYMSESTPLSIFGKPTAQSTTLLQYTSNKAADGIRETNLYPNYKCTHTESQRNPWWRVDLGGVHCIASVIILNRGDCCSDRLTGAVVRVGSSPTVTNNNGCGFPVTRAQASQAGGTIGRTCQSPLVGRYVGVEIPTLTPVALQLCEVTVMEVPLYQCQKPARLSIVGKPTAQSTTHLQYTSNKAADENRQTNMYPNFQCTHTESHRNPWWRVDLGGVHCIASVIILNRGDCCSDRLTGAVVRVGSSSTVTDNKACGFPVTRAEASHLGGTIERACQSPLRARYVGIEIPTETPVALQLCEVTVMEVPLDQCPKPVPLSIVGELTSQSSTLSHYTSDKAVDGIRETNMYPNFRCTHTVEQYDPWWRVDLSTVHCIESVSILNRGDCCSGRLTNAVIRVGSCPTAIENMTCGSPVSRKGANVPGGTIGRVCPNRCASQYILIEIPTGTPSFLQLCEVTVKELPLNQCG